MNSLHCSPLTLADLPAIARLDTRCFGYLWSQSAYRREIESPNSDLLGVFACDQNTPQLLAIGCTWAILEEAHITLLGVDPDYHRQGIGQWLLMQLLQAAIARHLHHATLEVRQSNTSAQALYAKFGFQVLGERKHYYSDDESALVLWKRGLQTSSTQADLAQLAIALHEKLHLFGWHPVHPLPLPTTNLCGSP